MTSRPRFRDVSAIAVILVVVGILGIRAQFAPGAVVDNGPHGIRASASRGRSPFAGAINAVVPHPTNPDVMWIGAVNGGVWKTTTATHATPHWVPQTDHEASLSIGDLALDPTIATADVLVAGIGASSSFSGTSGPLTGLLRTTDGGGTWKPLGQADLAGESITGVAPRGDVIVVASRTGLWRKDESGPTFHHQGAGATSLFCDGSGRLLKNQHATTLLGDPTHTSFLYAGIPGPDGGIFFSTTTGALWCEISLGGTFGQPGGTDFIASGKRVALAVHDDGKQEVVYAGVLSSEKASAFLFRSTDHGATWTRMDNPRILKGDDVRFMSMQADPTLPTVVYIGGDGLGGPGGLIFRCDAALPLGSQCESIARQHTLDNSAPHGDSRALQFDALGTLLDVSDGGISRRFLPQ